MLIRRLGVELPVGNVKGVVCGSRKRNRNVLKQAQQVCWKKKTV